MIKWTNGLSVGVKVLDDDHKKLLDIINNFSDAIDEDARTEEFEYIFSELDEYVTKHFKREESFIEQCAYDELDEHKRRHDSFANSIPQLKKRFFEADNYIDAKEVSMFLTDWLINHIINEDMKLFSSFEKCGFTEKKEKEDSRLNKLLSRATNIFPFTKRMYISALIPLIGMLILGSILLLGEYEKYKSVNSMSKVTSIVFEINNLSHALQIERGLSSGYLFDSNKFREKLSKGRKKVDILAKDFFEKIDTVSLKEIPLISKKVKIIKSDLKTLPSIREMVDFRTTSQQDQLHFYTGMINNILGITNKIIFINTNSDIAHSVATLASLLNMKEISGQIRAEGTILIEKKSKDRKELNTFIELFGAEKMFHTPYKEATLKKENEDPIEQRIKEYKKKIVNAEYKVLDSSQWFLVTTEYIDALKQVIDKHLKITDNLITENLNRVFNNLVLWSIFIFGILILTRFVVKLFEKSTRKQIHHITEAMKHLAFGGRSMRLSGAKEGDEISQIYEAYEVTRQKLLKGDIFTQLYVSQEKVKLENEKRENLKLEDMAFVDSLTQTLNRRKFEEIAMLEMHRASRHGDALSLLMLDIDHFKNVNDTYGHDIGDEVLKEFSSICKGMAREEDVVARIGGEEFVILLPQTDKQGAVVFANRLRESIYVSSIKLEDAEIKYSVSIGVSVFDSRRDDDVKSMLKRADEALYRAKDGGRNRVEVG